MRRTKVSTLSPEIGNNSTFCFSTSARNSGSLAVASNARRNIWTRSAGTPAAQRTGGHFERRQHEFRELTILRCLGELHQGRHMRQISVLRQAELHENSTPCFP